MKLIVIPALCLAAAAFCQARTMSCDDNNGGDRRFCEIRETTIASGGRLDIDGGVNGGIAVKGSDRSDVLIRTKVEVYRDDSADARRIASGIHIETAGGRIRATGPDPNGRHGWGVSFEILAPRNTDLVLHTHNGGIDISDVRGHLQFEAVNGGLSLNHLAGSVEGRTTNGGVDLELAQDHWDGEKCDVSTTNGGVTIRVPSNYSAHLETGTVNGGMRVDFPVTVQGELHHHLAVDLGAGGRLVRATTTNGGVSIERSM
ncbi:MAG: DUF4097 family beta strand repeat-containing protein [Bryobacteraceae bacterium]